ncbi:hypothetical protein BJX63DRAFT_303850 [Aspergillus granulosus]|uniref:Uncharacterized protein n=1 Tax=Aspergillus granulosus TaxID=176169 RepID=A0ABR4H5K5_9EURO
MSLSIHTGRRASHYSSHTTNGKDYDIALCSCPWRLSPPNSTTIIGISPWQESTELVVCIFGEEGRAELYGNRRLLISQDGGAVYPTVAKTGSKYDDYIHNTKRLGRVDRPGFLEMQTHGSYTLDAHDNVQLLCTALVSILLVAEKAYGGWSGQARGWVCVCFMAVARGLHAFYYP